jgi:hypothetical protein
LPRGVRKELVVSLLTVFGVLSTVGVSYLLRHVAVLRNMAVAGEPHYVGLVIYGLAISLIVAAATAIRARDAIVLLLAATVIWVVFVEARQIFGMVRFLVFSAVAGAAVLSARRAFGAAGAWLRVAGGTLVPAAACCVAGLAFYGLAARLGHGPAGSPCSGRDLAAGAVWGLSLGLAVGLGLSAGSEVVRWMSREDS